LLRRDRRRHLFDQTLGGTPAGDSKMPLNAADALFQQVQPIPELLASHRKSPFSRPRGGMTFHYLANANLICQVPPTNSRAVAGCQKLDLM
jgi:hypothetical protein